MSSEQIMGFGWYTRRQWEKLKEVADDPEALHDHYEDWVKTAEEGIERMRENGIRVEKIEVDIDDLVAWCREHDRRNTGGTRSEYITKQLQKRYNSGEIER